VIEQQCVLKDVNATGVLFQEHEKSKVKSKGKKRRRASGATTHAANDIVMIRGPHRSQSCRRCPVLFGTIT